MALTDDLICRRKGKYLSFFFYNGEMARSREICEDISRANTILNKFHKILTSA